MDHLNLIRLAGWLTHWWIQWIYENFSIGQLEATESSKPCHTTPHVYTEGVYCTTPFFIKIIITLCFLALSGGICTLRTADIINIIGPINARLCGWTATVNSGLDDSWWLLVRWSKVKPHNNVHQVWLAVSVHFCQCLMQTQIQTPHLVAVPWVTVLTNLSSAVHS